MILGNGICSIFFRSARAFVLRYQSWYGELSFETQPYKDNVNNGVQNSARIRVLQNREIIRGDQVLLRQANSLSDEEAYYFVERAYHGLDDDNGQPITDLTLTLSLMTDRVTLIEGVAVTDSMGPTSTQPSATGRRIVAAEVQTISTEERYQAMAYGEKPEVRALIYADEYADEPFVLLDGNILCIQRKEKNGIRIGITCERAKA
jgi:SPP1 family predicted phage head-tail adaptor